MDQFIDSIADAIAARVVEQVKPLLQPNPVPQLVTVEKASEILAVNRNTIYELMAKNKLPSVNIGRSRRIPLWAITAYIERNINEQEAA